MARVVPLMGRRRGDQPAEACRLVGELLAAGQRGGFAADAARQARLASHATTAAARQPQRPY